LRRIAAQLITAGRAREVFTTVILHRHPQMLVTGPAVLYILNRNLRQCRQVRMTGVIIQKRKLDTRR